MIRLLIASAIFTLFATPAFAYIDAALGGLILQSLIAGFFSFMVIWRGWVYRVKRLFRRASDETEITSNNSEEQQG